MILPALLTLPWKVDEDWTDEIHDAHGNCVAKCMKDGGAFRVVDAVNEMRREVKELREALRLIVEAQPEWRTAVDSIVEERHPGLRRERHAKGNACVDCNSTTRDESVVGDVGYVVHKPWCPQLKAATT